MAVEWVQAGARAITTWKYLSKLQLDWARAATAEPVTRLFAQRRGAFGQDLLWEWDLLDLEAATRRRRALWRQTIDQSQAANHKRSIRRGACGLAEDVG